MAAFAIVEAPSHLGLRAAGVEELPDALLAEGLAERLGARRAGRPTIAAMDLAGVRERGVERAVREALAHLEREDGPAGFWIHLDVDVLDDAIMPAVDYRLPDGLRWDELRDVLRAATASSHAVGLEITIFNPTLDPDGGIARALVDALVAGLVP